MRIATWNMQGGGGTNDIKNRTLQKMFTEGHDVICLQEATRPLGRFSVSVAHKPGVKVYRTPAPTNTSLRLTPEQHYTCYWYRWGANPRCSLIIYAKNGRIGTMDYGATLVPTYIEAGQRPMLWVRVIIDGHIYRVGNVHLVSGNPPKALKVFSFFKSKMQALQSIDRYAIAGDFNMDINYLTGRVQDPELSYFHQPNVMTHQGGHKLDYVYYGHRIDEIGYSEGFNSDHRFLVCSLI